MTNYRLIDLYTILPRDPVELSTYIA